MAPLVGEALGKAIAMVLDMLTSKNGGAVPTKPAIMAALQTGLANMKVEGDVKVYIVPKEHVAFCSRKRERR